MRSLLIVRQDGNLSTFRRLTGVAEKKGSWWSHYTGDHSGVILERRHVIYLVGLNRVGNEDPTMLVVRWIPNSDPILGGHATILTPAGPSVIPVVIVPCERGTRLRTAIKNAHVVPIDDASIDQLVLDALEQQSLALQQLVKPLDLAVTPTAPSPINGRIGSPA